MVCGYILHMYIIHVEWYLLVSTFWLYLRFHSLKFSIWKTRSEKRTFFCLFSGKSPFVQLFLELWLPFMTSFLFSFQFRSLPNASYDFLSVLVSVSFGNYSHALIDLILNYNQSRNVIQITIALTCRDENKTPVYFLCAVDFQMNRYFFSLRATFTHFCRLLPR